MDTIFSFVEAMEITDNEATKLSEISFTWGCSIFFLFILCCFMTLTTLIFFPGCWHGKHHQYWGGGYEALVCFLLKFIVGNTTTRTTEMFSLFYGLWNYLFSKTEFHVLILGIDKAGKTVICSSFSFIHLS